MRLYGGEKSGICPSLVREKRLEVHGEMIAPRVAARVEVPTRSAADIAVEIGLEECTGDHARIENPKWLTWFF